MTTRKVSFFANVPMAIEVGTRCYPVTVAEKVSIVVQLEHALPTASHLQDLYTQLDGNVTMRIPIDMLLWCPECGTRHIDTDEFAIRVHHSHACQSCGMVWRPAIQPTRGVRHLPGFKNG